MVHRRILDAVQLKSALRAAAVQHCTMTQVSETSRDFIVSIANDDGSYSEIIDSRSLQRLAGRLEPLISKNKSFDPESFVKLLVDVAIELRQWIAQIDRSITLSPAAQMALQELLADFVLPCIVCLARSRRHSIPITAIDRPSLRDAIRERDRSQLIKVFRAALGLSILKQRSGDVIIGPVPRVFIATPLTRLNDASHQEVLEQAKRVRKLLNKLGMVTITPDPNLTPSTTTDEEPYELSRLERLLVAGSDLVIAVGAEHDSWGVSHAISWAEASCSIAVVAPSAPVFFRSRVLNATSHRTYQQDAEEDPDLLVSRLEVLLREMLSQIMVHTRRRLAVCSRLYKPVAEARTRVAGLGEALYKQSDLSRLRALEILDHPVMLSQASVAEVLALRRLPGNPLGTLLDHIFGNSSHYVSAERPSALSAESFANLESAARLGGWGEVVVLRLIKEQLRTTVAPGYVNRGSGVSKDDWTQLYRRIIAFGGEPEP